MTPDQLQFYGHALGMVRAARAGTLAEWRDHQRAVADLRPKMGAIYQPYPYPNRALVKALAYSLREGLISRADFADVLKNVMGRHEL